MRLETQRLVVIGDRLLILALEIPGGAAVRKGLREIRLQPQRLVIILDGAVVFFGVVESIAAVGVSVGIVRLEPDRLIQRLERSLHLAGLAKDFTAGAEGAGPIGILGYDGIDFGQGLGGLAAVMQRGGAGNRGVKPVALRRRRIVDQRGASLDQLRGLGGRKRRADDRRFGGRLSRGAEGGQDCNGKGRARGKWRNK